MAEDLTVGEIVSRTLRWMNNRGCTYRVYDGGRRRRIMVHRWPADKIKGSKPWLTEQIFSNNRLFSALLRRGKIPQTPAAHL